MKDSIKTLIKIAAAAAILFFGAPWLTVLLVGFAALKGVDLVGRAVESGRARRNAKPGVDKETLARNVSIHRQNTNKRFYDTAHHQWDLHSFPMDMHPDRASGGKVSYFTCAGVENVVKGEYLGSRFGRQRVRFSMEITDQHRAEDVANYIAENGLIGTTVNRLEDGRFAIVSDNAVDINTIVKEFYPPKTMEVKREILTTKQYVVSGCKSYEEALEKFKADRYHMQPAGDYVTVRDTVDGVAAHPDYSGSGLDLSRLQVGEYVINETSSELYSRKVTFNGGLDCTDEAMRSLAVDELDRVGVSRATDLVEDQCSAEPVLSDALQGKEPMRYIICNDKAVTISPDRDVPLDVDACMYIKFRSLDELRSVASGESSIQGHVVLVDTVRPAISDGEFLLAVPADRALLESLRMRGGDSDEVAQRYAGTGLSPADVQAAISLSELRGRGYLSAELTDNPDFSNATVNGVPMSEFNERIGSLVERDRADQLSSSEEASRWLRDAEKIRQIRIDLDMRSNELVITSSVQSQGCVETKVETHKLDDESMQALASRPAPSTAEMKDLLMQTHPDFFETYHVPGTAGEGRYKDPVEAFVSGRKPRLSEGVIRELEQKGQSEGQRQVKAQKKHEAQKKASSFRNHIS